MLEALTTLYPSYANGKPLCLSLTPRREPCTLNPGEGTYKRPL